MKRGTTQHWKIKALARELHVTRSHAVGIMECLWQYTAEACPNGSWKNLSPLALAAEADRKDGQAMVAAMLRVHILDDDFMVHDWPVHCEDWVHMRLARAGKKFACGCAPRQTRLAKELRQKADGNELYCPRHREEMEACAQRAHGTRTCAPVVRNACALPWPEPEPESSLSPRAREGMSLTEKIAWARTLHPDLAEASEFALKGVMEAHPGADLAEVERSFKPDMADNEALRPTAAAALRRYLSESERRRLKARDGGPGASKKDAAPPRMWSGLGEQNG